VVQLLRRRELIATAGVALGGAAALPAGGAADVLGLASNDRQLLTRLVEIEQLVVSGYRRVLGAGVLSPAARRAASQFIAHERAHVRKLSAQLLKLGGATTTGSTLTKLGVSGSLDNSHDAVRYLIALETLTESAYYGAIARLSDPRLLRLVGEIMACEAQHWTAFSGLLQAGDVYAGVPQPVVTGR
jgi:rubrerythrin